MKISLFFAISLFTVSSYAFNVGDLIKCQGYFEKNKNDRIYYELEGKILKSLGRHYMIYGYTPVFESKRLHKVLKISCVGPEESFIEEVVEVKNESVPLPDIQVVADPRINNDEEESILIEEEFNRASVEFKNTEIKEPTAPINEKKIKAKTSLSVKEKTQPKVEISGCSEVSKKSFFNIIKCFIKDGYGSI